MTELTVNAESQEHADVPRVGFFSGFDGLRAIAALLVVTTHAWLESSYRGSLSPYFTQMDIGVPIFFVISGFLLYRPFVAARFAGKTPIGFREFWKRRVLRIFPAYLVALVIIGFFMVQPRNPINSVGVFFLHAFLLQVYSAHRVIGGPIQQSWTLAVELAFYAFLPMYAWCIRKVRATPNTLLAVELGGVAALYMISVVYRVALLENNLSDAKFSQARIWMPGFLDQLALGMGIAVVSAYLAQRNRDANAPRWLAGAAWGLAAVLYWVLCKHLGLPLIPTDHRTHTEYMSEQFVRGIIAALVVLPAVFVSRRRGIIRGFLSTRIMVFLGLISYGIYLWHEAWLDQWRAWRGIPFGGASMTHLMVACLVFTIPTAALSYYLIERPALRLKTRKLRRSVSA
jgi:peptidoglycan/LPS O-acetylase OafA/YrhL